MTFSPDSDPDDLFLQITQGIELDADTTDVEDVTSLDDMVLLNRYAELNEALKSLGEQLQLTTSTPEGRELHSRRTSVVVELHRRGLL